MMQHPQTGEGPEGADRKAAEVTDLYREQLKRACADALEALHRTQSVDGLAGVAESSARSGRRTAFMGS